MVRIAAVSDLHFTVEDQEKIRERFAGVAEQADLLLLPGDLTDHGNDEEGRLLGGELQDLGIPVLAVLGNHDFAARQVDRFMSVLGDYGVVVLDGQSKVLDVGGTRVGVAGACGFRGGFGKNVLIDDSEPECEAWILRAKDEAAKLDVALEGLDCEVKIAMLHYAPIEETIIGERLQNYPFNGSSHLLPPIEKHQPDLVVHGHSHKGTHKGSTPGGIPVYNVAVKVIKVPYVVLELGN